jgi:predicted metalloendopeptidase
MYQYLFCAMGVVTLAVCATEARAATGGATPASTVLGSGVDLQYVDHAVRPQDDLYRYLNGKWLDTFQIPADKATYVSFTYVFDQVQDQLKTIVDGLGEAATGGDADAKKMADLYASFMDEAKLEALGLKPLQAEFARIDAIAGKKDIPALIARFNRTGAVAPYDFDVELDARDSTKYAVNISQSGLGMPDRDYYLKDDPKLVQARTKYVAHVEKLLGLAGDKEAAQNAAAILKLETSMAQIQWTKVENRDPIKTYNKTPISALGTLTPGYDWRGYVQGLGLSGKVDYVIINQPSYFTGLAKLIEATPLPVWKAYFKWHVLSAAAPYLSKPFVDERFAFSGTTLRGIPQNLPRWKRGLILIDGAIGEALGKLYVAKYFPPENKARMDQLVSNLIAAYSQDIDTLDWMSADTKKGAHEKLAKLVRKIGYPNKWRDYSKLTISRDDLFGNVRRATEFEVQRNIDKLGKPIDRNEWDMTPQTVNAYYDPEKNEIVFPAAILQPPFFNVKADDAVNYGGIGAVIGHEISHGFDDQGSQFDADGNLHDWFTKDDHEKFGAKTKALVAQYSAHEPVPGFHVNGELTLGENIADNSGLAIAYKAYKISLGGKPSPTIDGFTGEQRLYLGWVQVWRGKGREEEAIMRIKSDPHSPPAIRGMVPVSNQDGFYAAFGVKPGDKMYLPPDQRVALW